MPTRHHKALQSATKTKKTYTNRPRPGARRRRRRSGRGLEGRAHQAACRRPRSGAEAGFEVQVARALFLYSINWVPPLPPDFSPDPHCDSHFSCFLTWRPQVSKQEAPTPIRPRRRSPNAVCHFLQKLKISSKYSPPGSPIRSFFVPFWSLFHKSGPRGPGPHPKVPTRHQHGPQGYTNGAQGCRNEAPRSPQSGENPSTHWSNVC